jgi:hypothetical protein
VREVNHRLPRGYGDVITTLTYYFQASYVANSPIQINLRSVYADAIDRNNAESAGDRARAIFDMFDTSFIDVDLKIYQDSQYDIDEWHYGPIRSSTPFRTFWMTKEKSIDDNKTVAVWLPNKLPKDKIDKKQHMSVEQWNRLVSWCDSQYDVKFIDYDTPIENVIEWIRTCHFCAGYEGIGQFISKQFFKPILTFSKYKGPALNHGGTWSEVYTSRIFDHRYLKSIDTMIDEQQKEIRYVQERLQEMYDYKIF